MAHLTKSQIREVVRTAFLETHEGRSADDVVIDDRLNAQFVRAVSRLAPDIDASTVNWQLLNLRKASRLGPVATVRKTLRNQEDYVHAAEIAARFLEDQYETTIDRIICNPKMRREFDRVATSIAPGYIGYEYRKAALKLRKAGRLKPELVKRIMRSGAHTRLMQAELLLSEPQLVPDLPGVYSIADDSGYLYIGESGNLRLRLLQHLDHSDSKSLAHYFWQNGIRRIKVEFIAFRKNSLGASAANRRVLEVSLIQSRQPRFNIQHLR